MNAFAEYEIYVHLHLSMLTHMNLVGASDL
jgi:hypothetical protein